MPGHETGHLPDGSFDWGDYVLDLVQTRGGWTVLADELLLRGRHLCGFPEDLGTIEKGLRRLARRGNASGGKYGKWVLRFFGVDEGLERWVARLGQYHSRFADLPATLRLAQLNLWEKPPLTESTLQPWFDIGVASVLHRLRHYDEAMSRLQHLRPDDIVVMDNLQAHKNPDVLAGIRSVGASAQFLPPHSPEWNPIERVWSKVKAQIRQLETLTRETLDDAVAHAMN